MRRPSFRKGSMFRLGGLVNHTLDDLGLRHRVLEQQALSRWKEVVGAHIASSSSADRVRDGVLFVSCRSSMWANELALHKERIVKGLNKALGRNVISDIRFSARGFGPADKHASKEQTQPWAKTLEAVELTDEQIQHARAMASASASPELAEKIEKALLTSKRLAEAKRQEGWKACSVCGAMHLGSGSTCPDCAPEGA